MIIGQQCRAVGEAESLNMVAGYAIGLDMTVRGPEDRSFRKSHDSYSIVGPCLVTPDEVPNPDNLDMRLSVNGELRQDINTSELVYSVRRLIAYASETYTLYPGDILFTGTPHGVGPVTAGDEIKCAISGIGEMRVHVRNCAN